MNGLMLSTEWGRKFSSTKHCTLHIVLVCFEFMIFQASCESWTNDVLWTKDASKGRNCHLGLKTHLGLNIYFTGGNMT